MKSEQLVFGVGSGFRRSSTSTNYSTRESSPANNNNNNNRLSPSPKSSLSVSPVPPPFLPLTPETPKRRTPVPADSPLLQGGGGGGDGGGRGALPPPADPALQKVKNFNRNLRRTRSFRACRERSSDSLSSLPPEVLPEANSNANTNANSTNTNGNGNNTPHKRPRVITLAIRKSTFGRRGWKVMPAEDGLNLKLLHPDVIEGVVNRIRELELSGLPVPERMTLQVT